MLIAEYGLNRVIRDRFSGFTLNTDHTADVEISSIAVVGLGEVGCSGGAPLVSMMQPAHLPNRCDPAQHRRLNRSGLWGVLLQCQMGAAPMIVINEALKMSAQTALIKGTNRAH